MPKHEYTDIEEKHYKLICTIAKETEGWKFIQESNGTKLFLKKLNESDRFECVKTISTFPCSTKVIYKMFKEKMKVIFIQNI